MILEIDSGTVDFLCKKKISFNQFCILLLIYRKDYNSIIKLNEATEHKLGNRLIKKGDGELINEVDDLIERDFLLNHNLIADDPYDLDNFVVTTKFTKGFLIDIEDAAKELWKEYPSFIRLGDGKEVSTTVCDYEDFEEKYYKVIQYNLKLHNEIISKLKKYKKSNSYAEMNIMNFIGSRHWEKMIDNEQRTTRYI